MREQPIELWAAPLVRDMPESAPGTCLDAVGRPVAVGDTVWAIVGTTGAPSRVQRLNPHVVVVRRDDGMVAVLRPSSVVRLRPAGRDSDLAS